MERRRSPGQKYPGRAEGHFFGADGGRLGGGGVLPRGVPWLSVNKR
jgi:hypothetical protein